MDNAIENNLQWYAIRVTYSRELAVKGYLDDRDIGNYVPMHCIERTVAGRKHKEWQPMIHNLIFIHTTAELLRQLKTTTTLPICYIMNRAEQTPLTIPDRQMEDFMQVVAAQDGRAEILDPQAAKLANGDWVRVTEGPFAGVEGRYICHKGRHKVAVEIRGVATALTAYIARRSVERTEPPGNAGKKVQHVGLHPAVDK